MADIIIFGVNDSAQLAHYYLTHDSDHDVVAFTVHNEYLPEDALFCKLPVFPFESLASQFPAADYAMFAPMTAVKMNRLRESVYQQICVQGYQCISYISSHATVLSDHIGENCFILEDNTVQPFTQIGNNVVLWSGNHIGHHSVIEDHAFLTSHVVVSGHCRIGRNSFIGVNTTLRDGVRLAQGSFIAMSSAITKDTEPWKAYAGNPARKLTKSSLELEIYHEMD